jgi:effector-binding domain-containing protein
MVSRNDSEQSRVRYMTLEEILVAQIRIHGTVSDLPKVFSELDIIVGDHKVGSPIVVHHWGVSDSDGHDMDVCFPIDVEFETNMISIDMLPAKEAMTLIHRGSYAEIGSSYTKIRLHTYERGLPIAESTREVYHQLDVNAPDETVVEIQTILHDWFDRFNKQVEEVLGPQAKEEVIAPLSTLSIDSTASDRHKALCRSLRLLETKTNEVQQYVILSHCAHVFPVELIPPLQDLFRKTGSVDVVIEAMKTRGGFYPKNLRREGGVIYSEKGPANPIAYKDAKTVAERRRAYCFCPLIRDSIDETPEVFCNCSAGWPKQLWEGILETPLQIEITKSLTRGEMVV